MAQTGQVGDFVGGIIGSIWSLAGVFLYFSALHLQQKELKSQREEMVANQRLLDQQLFETTFFNLLKVQDNIRNNIRINFYYPKIINYHVEGNIYEVKGCDFFNEGLKELAAIYLFVLNHKFEKTNKDLISEQIEMFYRSYYDDETQNFDDENRWTLFKQWIFNQYRGMVYRVNENTFKTVHESNDERCICAYSYWLFYHKYENGLGHYCRHFYNIIKFLDDYKKSLLNQLEINSSTYSDEKINNKINSYLAFVQSSLSSSELVMLYYNMLLFPNAERLYSEYNIFENMHMESLINIKHVSFFSKIQVKSVERFKEVIWKPKLVDSDDVNI